MLLESKIFFVRFVRSGFSEIPPFAFAEKTTKKLTVFKELLANESTKRVNKKKKEQRCTNGKGEMGVLELLILTVERMRTKTKRENIKNKRVKKTLVAQI